MTDGTVIYRDPVAGYKFSTFQTTYATDGGVRMPRKRQRHCSWLA